MNQDSPRSLWRFLADLGALRIILGLLAVLVIVFAPDPAVPTERAGWGLVTTGVMPALGPMIFMVVLLDAIMSRVLMVDKEGEALLRYKRALAFDLALAAAILISWLPFLIYLFSA